MTGRSSVAMPAVKPESRTVRDCKHCRQPLAHAAQACHSIVMTGLFRITCSQPWLVVDFPQPQRVLSWSINRPGFDRIRRVAWLEVRDADLPIDIDPAKLLTERLAAASLDDAVGMMTARDIRRHRCATADVDDSTSMALATVGLTNGVGFSGCGTVDDVVRPAAFGTINLLVASSDRLDDAALVEAVSIVATARTAALLADNGRIAATGTDCIVVACPDAGPCRPHAGLHTAMGRSLAAATFAAIRAAREDWETEFARRGS